MIYRVLRAHLEHEVRRSPGLIWHVLERRFVNRQRRSKADEIGERHYDTGNDLFQTMLDRRLNYSCGYWAEAEDLDAAQEAKLALICDKLQLQPGMNVLDIGCGWGSLAIFAPERYGVSVVGINNSKEQVELANRLAEGLPVEIRLQDYREEFGIYDRVVSVGMFEHVGPKNYATFMRVVDRCMKDDSLFLLHTIGVADQSGPPDLFMEKYIFPRSHLPTVQQIAMSMEGRFVMEDWHNFSADYDRTLMAWCRRLDNGWADLSSRYDERFRRMWRYYLLSCAGGFRARKLQLWQVVMSKRGVPGGYRSIR
jgi:cyclopropane-fatty-acyl-phospholipid synthase